MQSTLSPLELGDHDEGNSMHNMSFGIDKVEEKDTLQRHLDARKAGFVKQNFVGQMAQVSFVAQLVVEDEREDAGSPQQQAVSRPPRHASSKYDFVKVRVWLGDNSDHYYVLSRFLVSRMLTVTKIPNHVAIKIALELKKLLIDNSLLDVSQADLEANLFKLMERRGYGAEYINRYKMMTRFHHQRTPLVILVCGAACVGKSTIATQLAQRLNLPNVLQTDMVYELLRTATDPPLATTPVWAREFSSREELINEFCRECRIVRKGLGGDLSKAMTDGKPVIIEGIHLDPSLYLLDEKKEIATELATEVFPSKPSTLHCSSKTEEFDSKTAKHSRSPGSPELATSHALKALVENGNRGHFLEKEEAVNSGQEKMTAVDERVNRGSTFHPRLQSQLQVFDRGSVEEGASGSSRSVQGPQFGQQKCQEDEKRSSSKLPAKPIVVPIILRMADIDYQTLLEEWIACRSVDGSHSHEDMEALVRKFRIIQDYLCSFESQGVKIVNISATTFPQTLDWLHSYLLQCIERGCAAPNQMVGL